MKAAWAAAAALALLAPAARGSAWVGSAVCASCHAAQAQAWGQSHHRSALQPATRESVLAPFAGETYRAGGVTSRFTSRGGRFYVVTDDADGRMREHEVAHTIGVAPLQQYLVPRPDGSLHALALAWDARPSAQGGQRWFHLQGEKPPPAGDALHWTGRLMNASFMCVECHVSGYAKNYDGVNLRYASRWREHGVACEACHGAGSKHVEWARGGRSGAGTGLALTFDQRRNVQWRVQAASGNAIRSEPAPALRKEEEVCARCHSHRSRIGADAGPPAPLQDAWRPSLVEPGLFYGDGQMRAEVFEHAPFLQSRMHARGVTCSDCHEPHSQRLRAPGNAVCFQCHAPAKFDAPAHHFHRAGSSGAQCVACHMPATTYMSIHPRHDHFIRVPQPEQSMRARSPDACTQCHRDKPQAWAAQWTRRWYPGLERRRSPLAAAAQAFDAADWRSIERLASWIGDGSQPAIVRASVLQRLPPDAGPAARQQATRALDDPDGLVRRAAVDALRDAEPLLRVRLLAPRLGDAVRDVRIAAARWLAPVRGRLPAGHLRSRYDAALREYAEAQRANADRPEAHDNLGALWAELGDLPRAQAAFRDALRLEPGRPETLLNLADLERQRGREASARRMIADVLRRKPDYAAAHHALGLALLRAGRRGEAIASLRKACGLAPGNAQFALACAAAR